MNISEFADESFYIAMNFLMIYIQCSNQVNILQVNIIRFLQLEVNIVL